MRTQAYLHIYVLFIQQAYFEALLCQSQGVCLNLALSNQSCPFRSTLVLSFSEFKKREGSPVLRFLQ